MAGIVKTIRTPQEVYEMIHAIKKAIDYTPDEDQEKSMEYLEEMKNFMDFGILSNDPYNEVRLWIVGNKLSTLGDYLPQQLIEYMRLANEYGVYDMADFIKRYLESK